MALSLLRRLTAQSCAKTPWFVLSSIPVQSPRLNPHDSNLGLDLGCYSSKQALAWEHPTDGQIHVIRVNLHGDLDHPERRNAPNTPMSAFEFIAYAALVDGARFVVGRPALGLDDRVQIKVILHHLAGINVAGLPKGRKLLRWCQTGEVTREMMEAALNDHFTLLWEMASVKADRANLQIVAMVWSFPNYMSQHEKEDDFDKLRSYLFSFIQTRTPSHMALDMASEGQCSCIAVCQEHYDPMSAVDQEELSRHFDGLRGDNGLYQLQIDCGSSTCNLYPMFLYFDKERNIYHNQWVDDPTWSPGIIGGSHMLNDAIERMIIPQLEELGAHLVEGGVESVMGDFELKKRELDFAADGPPLKLQGFQPWIVARLSGAQVHQAFQEVFGPGFWVFLKREIHKIIAKKHDLAIVFAGGSFCNPGMWRKAEEMMKTVVKRAARDDVRVKYGRLADFNPDCWASDVSVGAALSRFSLPAPVELIIRSAIGIQVQKRVSPGRWEPVGHDAQVLLAAGSGESSSFRFKITPSIRSKTRFSLLCDPSFDHRSAGGRIRVDDKSQDERAPFCVYDLSWTLGARELHKGPAPESFAFSFSGKDHELLTATGSPDLRDKFRGRSIVLLLNCCICDRDGALQPSASDRRWQISLKVHPGSRLLLVEEVVPLPIWCPGCSGHIGTKGYVCTSCDDFVICEDCYNDDDLAHDEDHEFVAEVYDVLSDKETTRAAD